MACVQDPDWYYAFEPIQVELHERSPKAQVTQVTATPVIVWDLGFHGSGFGLMMQNLDAIDHPSEAFYHDGNLYLSTVVRLDFINFWRGALLLCECSKVDSWLVQRVVFEVFSKTELNALKDGDRENLLASVRGGRETIVRIRSASPPDWLIERALRIWDVSGSSAVPWTLMREVRAGRLEWREEFRAAGALTPQEEDAQEALWHRIQPRFDPILQRASRAIYERHKDASRARRELLHLVQSGALEEHGPFITAALALVASRRPAANILVQTSVWMGTNPWVSGEYYDHRERWALKQLAPWVARRLRTDAPFDPDQVVHMHRKLVALMERYFPNDRTTQRLEALAQKLNARSAP